MPEVGFIIVLNGISNKCECVPFGRTVGFIIVLNGISNIVILFCVCVVVGFIIVLNGISNYKVVCDDVRMGVNNRVFFYLF